MITVLFLAAAPPASAQQWDPVLAKQGSRLGEPVSDSALAVGLQAYYVSAKFVRRVVEDGELIIPWLNLPAWHIPDDPDWQEDPFNNNAWAHVYHSLIWTLAYGVAFDQTGDRRHLERLKTLVLDYLDAVVPPEYGAGVSPLTDSTTTELSLWSSLTGGKRAETLAYVYHKYLRTEFSDDQRDRLVAFLRLNSIRLSLYLLDDTGHKENHAVMVAQGMLKMARVFPDLPDSQGWYDLSRKRLHDLVLGMSDPVTGASTEQAAFYHYFAIELFMDVRDVARALDEQLQLDLDAHLGKMLAYAALITYPDGTIPAYGDSRNRLEVLSKLRRLYERWGGTNSEIEAVLSRGKQVSRLPRVTTIDSEGYVILRPESGSVGHEEWAIQPVIFIDFGDVKLTHGHDDAMSFLAYFDGEAMLVDMGGPYSYMASALAPVSARSRGNTLVVDGYEHIDNSARVEATYDTDDFVGATGSLTQQGVKVTRTVLWTRNRNLVVLDHAVPVDGKSHSYSLFHHFPSGADVAASGTKFQVSTEAGHEIVQTTYASSDTRGFVRLPADGDEPLSSLGWVTTGYVVAEPAPVTEVVAESAGDIWFATVFYPVSLGIEADAAQVQNGEILELRTGDLVLSYALREDRLDLVPSE